MGRYGNALSSVTFGLVGKSVNSTDVAVGAVGGLVGAELAEWGAGKLSQSVALPAWAYKLAPLLGGAVAGGALYAMGHKKSKQAAEGKLLGALAVGAAVSARNFLVDMLNKAAAPTHGYADYRLQGYGDPLQRVSMGDYTRMQGYGDPLQRVSMGGVLLDQGMNGVILNDGSLQGLADDEALEGLGNP